MLPSYAEYEARAIAGALEILLEEDEDWDGEEVPPTRANLHAVMTRVMTKQVQSAASSHPPPPLASHR